MESSLVPIAIAGIVLAVNHFYNPEPVSKMVVSIVAAIVLIVVLLRFI